MNNIYIKIALIFIINAFINYSTINAQKLLDDYKIVKSNNQKTLIDDKGEQFVLAENESELTPNTTALVLKANIKKLPEAIFNFPNLKILILKGNLLTSLPEKFTLLPNLEVLDLSQNNLYVLPKSIMNLKKMKRLDLSDNLELISTLHGFENLNQIEKLWLNHTFVSNIPTLGLSNLQLFEQNKMLSIDTILTHTPKLNTLFAQHSVASIEPMTVGIVFNFKFYEVIFGLKELKKLSINCAMFDISIPKFCQLNKLESLEIYDIEAFHVNNLDMIYKNSSAIINLDVQKEVQNNVVTEKSDSDEEEVEKTDEQLLKEHIKDSLDYFKLRENTKLAFNKCLANCKLSFSKIGIEGPEMRRSVAYRNEDNNLLKNAKNAYLEDNQSPENKVNLTTKYCATALAQISINELEIAENLLAEAKKVDNTHFDILKVQLCLYIYKGKMEDAKALVSKWKNKPFDVDISFNKAFAEAIADANKLELAPDEVVKNLGVINKMLK